MSTRHPTKSVLITGSSRGIGKAVALELSRHGYTIVLHGRSSTQHLASTRKQIQDEGGSVRQISFDVADREAAKKTLEYDITKNGMYYGVVLNAGISRDNAFPFMSEEDWDDVLSTNLDGFYNVLKPLVENFITARQNGRVVIMTSIAGILGNRGQVNYSAAKAGLIGAAKALGLELAKRKITVNCIAPGLIETDMTMSIDRDRILSMIPMRRMGHVREVSCAVTFLMSEEAAYITRQTITIDGGLS